MESIMKIIAINNDLQNFQLYKYNIHVLEPPVLASNKHHITDHFSLQTPNTSWDADYQSAILDTSRPCEDLIEGLYGFQQLTNTQDCTRCWDDNLISKIFNGKRVGILISSFSLLCGRLPSSSFDLGYKPYLYMCRVLWLGGYKEPMESPGRWLSTIGLLDQDD